MGILFLIVAAYIADKVGRPLSVAAIFAGFSAILGWLNNEPIVEVAIGSAMTFVFCSIYFSMLVKYSDQVFVWFIILLGFPLALFFLPILAGAT